MAMREVKLHEIWSDGKGTMAVLREDGTYNFYFDPESVTVNDQRLSTFPFVMNMINQSLLSILNAKKS